MAATGRASGASLEFSAGMAVPSYDSDRRIGPQFTLGLRHGLHRYVDGLITVDVNYSRLDHTKMLRTESVSSKGANRTILQAAVNLSPRFEKSPPVYVGIGGYYASYSDLVSYYYDGGSETHEIDSETGLILQAGFHLGIIQTRPGNVFVSGRLVHEIGGARYHRLWYIPITAGFRFN